MTTMSGYPKGDRCNENYWALVSSISVTVLLLALMPVLALGHDGGTGGTCTEDGDWVKIDHDDPHEVKGDFGSIVMSGNGSDELLTADINEGYAVEICVKQANGHDHFTVTSGSDETVWDGDLSHWAYRVIDEPDDNGTTTTVDEATATTVDDETTTTGPTTTTTVAGTTSSEATTTTIEATTSSEGTTDSTLPFTGSEAGDWAAVAASMLMVGGLALLVARTRHFDA